MRGVLKDRGGHEVDVAGDGLFAVFDEPAQAVRFAADTAVAVRVIGLEVRAGVHFGQCEVTDGRPAGIVVHTGARTMGTGEAGQATVSSTVVHLMPGGAFGFADHGTHEFKGVPGTWQLFRLVDVDAESVGTPLSDDEAAARKRQASAAPPVVRRRTFMVGVAGALVGGSAITLLLTRRHPLAQPGPLRNRLFRFEPSTGVFTAMPVTLRTPSVAVLPSLAFGEGAVWVGDEELRQVDPRGTARSRAPSPPRMGLSNPSLFRSASTTFGPSKNRSGCSTRGLRDDRPTAPWTASPRDSSSRSVWPG